MYIYIFLKLIKKHNSFCSSGEIEKKKKKKIERANENSRATVYFLDVFYVSYNPNFILSMSNSLTPVFQICHHGFVLG